MERPVQRTSMSDLGCNMSEWYDNQVKNRIYSIPLTSLGQEAATKDSLPDAPAGDGGALGLGDAAGSVVTGTATNNTAAEESAHFVFPLPAEYVSGGAITMRLRGKVSANRDTAQTLVVVVKKMSDALGGDLNATSLQTVTTSYANYDFTITPTGLVAGDILYVEILMSMDDSDGGTGAGTGTISAISVICAGFGA